ncbi:MAG: hypothetical protein ABR604_00865 [Jatrophihabitantaceae bacterium]
MSPLTVIGDGYGVAWAGAPPHAGSVVVMAAGLLNAVADAGAAVNRITPVHAKASAVIRRSHLVQFPMDATTASPPV